MYYEYYMAHAEHILLEHIVKHNCPSVNVSFSKEEYEGYTIAVMRDCIETIAFLGI